MAFRGFYKKLPVSVFKLFTLINKLTVRQNVDFQENDNLGHHFQFQLHSAGDVTRVSVMPRMVTVKIGDAENWCWGCRDKNR